MSFLVVLWKLMMVCNKDLLMSIGFCRRREWNSILRAGRTNSDDTKLHPKRDWWNSRRHFLALRPAGLAVRELCVEELHVSKKEIEENFLEQHREERFCSWEKRCASTGICRGIWPMDGPCKCIRRCLAVFSLSDYICPGLPLRLLLHKKLSQPLAAAGMGRGLCQQKMRFWAQGEMFCWELAWPSGLPRKLL